MSLNWKQYLPFNGPMPQGHETIPMSVPDDQGRRWVEVPAADAFANYGGGGSTKVVGPFVVNGTDPALSANASPNVIFATAPSGTVILDAWAEVTEVFDHGVNGLTLRAANDAEGTFDFGQVSILATQTDGQNSQDELFQGQNDQTSTIYAALTGSQNLTVSQGLATLAANGAIARNLPIRLAAAFSIQAYISQAKSESLPTTGIAKVYFLVSSVSATF